MLPKVATTILHHTSRAAAAVQNQTHTLRNVLQLQSSSGPSASTGTLGPWNGPGPSSSNWGSNGPGPGGSKYNAGSRFHNGYTGAGRAVTQANAVTSHDLAPQNDDNDEFTSKRVSLHHTPHKRPRLRSHSLSIPIQGKHEPEQTLGVLSTIKIHTRARHVFAQPALTDRPSLADGGLISASVPADDLDRPSLVRRNSTSSPSNVVPDAILLDSLPHKPESSDPELPPLTTDPSAPQTTAPPPPPAFSYPPPTYTYPSPTPESENFSKLKAAAESGDPNRVAEEVLKFRLSPDPVVQEYNMAIDAIRRTRRPGEPLNLILEVYNDMLRRSVLPNYRTYVHLIVAFTERDDEVYRMIVNIERRVKRREFVQRTDSPDHESDKTLIAQLKSENNLASALSLFEAIVAIESAHLIPRHVFSYLIRSCAHHANVSAALRIFQEMELRTNGDDERMTGQIFKEMLSVYANAKETRGATEIFQEFRRLCKEDKIDWLSYSGDWPEERQQFFARYSRLVVWNKMIETYFRLGQPEAGVDLVHQMLNATPETEFHSANIPLPASSTFTAVIKGFCESGDIKSALTWFDMLLAFEERPQSPWDSCTSPTRPDQLAWGTMIDSLAAAGMIDDLNRLWKIFVENAANDGLQIRPVDTIVTFSANILHLKSLSNSSEVISKLDFLVETIINTTKLHSGQRRGMLEQVLSLYLEHGAIDQLMSLLDRYATSEIKTLYERQSGGELAPGVASNTVQTIKANVTKYTMGLIYKFGARLPFTTLLHMARIQSEIKNTLTTEFNSHFYDSYRTASANGQQMSELTVRDWELVAHAVASLEGGYTLPLSETPVKTISILQDMAKHEVDLERISRSLLRVLVKTIYVQCGLEELQRIFTGLGPSYAAILADPKNALIPSEPTTPLEPGTENNMIAPQISPVTVDAFYTRYVDEMLQTHDHLRSQPLVAYTRLLAGINERRYPGIPAFVRLIPALGRMGELEKVRDVYTKVQDLLASLEGNKKWQSQAWFQIEDSMIIALAHAGDIDSAHVHRVRILEQGGSPTADAYGALIQYVKDTTDDTSNALALFNEAQMQGVQGNQYLYNNIISKLAKARKADHALELFQQMKTANVIPSSITYGTVIAACARVGDSQSAELLFTEMVAQRNFKPRIPPYNTMIQLYTSTKPNRERALYYYNALRKAKVEPTAHTYKLLIDAYGTIAPIDTDAMQSVFQALESDPKVEIQGSHWAALINAWGCAKKDLNKAIEIFASIPTNAKSQQSSVRLPDAVVYEAIITVLVTHRRTDLLPTYIAQLKNSGVHMTAYIANFLIKGYAVMDDLDEARRVFESLEDPPQGMAAPNNHVPHAASSEVPASAPVFREPSTWEAMVRAELGAGNRDQATALLDRLRSRHYPEAVYNRISGIMHDESNFPKESPTQTPTPTQIYY